jgi:hypothetical protein
VVGVGQGRHDVPVDGHEEGGKRVVAGEEHAPQPDPQEETAHHFVEDERQGDGHEGRQDAEPAGNEGGGKLLAVLAHGEYQGKRRTRFHHDLPKRDVAHRWD